MSFVVQKYGGTSIGRAERMLQVCDIVKKNLEQDRIAVVLSAMSGYVKSEGTTSKLLEAAKIALHRDQYTEILTDLEKNHLNTVEEAIVNPEIQEELKEKVKKEFKTLSSFLEAIQVIGELSPRSHDSIISTGEKLSALIFTGVLNCRGIEAEYVNLDKLVHSDFKEVNQEFIQYLQARLAERITACEHRVPVITGFLGFVPNGIIEGIGRGYTDFTSALVAAAMKAKELQIWKEMDGVFTADPRKVENARPLKEITPEEAAELTYYGSEVIHPYTMEQVNRANIPIRIKNTFKPEFAGTIIRPMLTEKKHTGATAVTFKKGIIILNVNSNRMMMAYGFMSKVFDIFDKYGIVIDLIATSEVNISMTLDRENHLKEAIEELEKLGTVSVHRDMAIISLVGKGMKNTLGMAGGMFSVFSEAGINIEMISQGASEINISCVVKKERAEEAIQLIHKVLIES